MTYDTSLFIAMFDVIAQRIEKEKDHLCALDGQIGDADHGIAMAQGFNAVRKAVGEMDSAAASAADVFNTAARSFLNAVGASSGPLYATAFIRAGASLKGRSEPEEDDVVQAFRAMAQGIEDRGKAVPGEKTMVDAWRPAADALVRAREEGSGLAAALRAANAAAAQGAEATKDMIAAKGRSSRLGDRSRGHIDPGAASASIIIDAIAGHFASVRPPDSAG